jgi:hypothetical protein
MPQSPEMNMHTKTPYSAEHLLDEEALLSALLRKTHALIDALTSDTLDSAAVGHAVYDYIAGAMNAGVSRARIRDALELLVHEHGGSRWFGRAAAIAELAMQESWVLG